MQDKGLSYNGKIIPKSNRKWDNSPIGENMLNMSNSGTVSMRRSDSSVAVMNRVVPSKKEDVINFSDLMAMSNVHGTAKAFLDKVVACKNRYDNTDDFAVSYRSGSLALTAGILYVNDGFSVDRRKDDYGEKLVQGLKMYVSYLRTRKVYNYNRDVAGVYKSLKDIRAKLTVGNILEALQKSDVFCIFSDYYKVEIRKGKTKSIVEVDGHKIDLSK